MTSAAFEATPAFEVWGDPIAHSLSPALHRAAYAHLGLEWTYDRRQVAESDFDRALAARDRSLRGLSVTYPLKAAAYAVADKRDATATSTGAVNTLLIADDGIRGFNTDVPGLAADLREHGIAAPRHAHIIGAGATATSALVALDTLGVRAVTVWARRPEAAAPLVAWAASAGVELAVNALGEDIDPEPAEVTVAALPGGAALDEQIADRLSRAGGVLYDVVYGRGQSALATAWTARGGRSVDGSGMLLQQAVRQIRIFLTRSTDEPLPDEDAVIAVMRRALVGG